MHLQQVWNFHKVINESVGRFIHTWVRAPAYIPCPVCLCFFFRNGTCMGAPQKKDECELLAALVQAKYGLWNSLIIESNRQGARLRIAVRQIWYVHAFHLFATLLYFLFFTYILRNTNFDDRKEASDARSAYDLLYNCSIYMVQAKNTSFSPCNHIVCANTIIATPVANRKCR